MRNLYKRFAGKLNPATLLTASALACGLNMNAQYCAGPTANTCCEWITNVTFAGINNSTGVSGTGYEDYTNGTAATVVPGVMYPLSVTIEVDANDYVTAWIDWNQNLVFEAAEQIVLASATGSTGPFIVNVTVPGNAVPGTTRMRVRVKWASAPDACTAGGFGETEDYSVMVLPPALTVLIPSEITTNCYGDTNITIGSFTAGGTTPYTYLWSTGSTNDTIFNVGAGTYSVIVTDDSNNTDTAWTVVTDAPELNIDSIKVFQALVCDYHVADVEAYASGGIPQILYYTDTGSANFDPESSSGTNVTFSSNYNISAFLPIGFDFVFFGDTYSEFKLNTEGFITFENWGSGWTADHAIPNTLGPAAVIAFAWEDLDPTVGGTVSYYTTGTAPYQRLIVTYENVRYQGGTASDVINVQVKLFETTNCIEIHTTTVGNSTFAGNTVQGIENMQENVAYWIPGRNYQIWNATNDFVSFCPSGYTFDWSDGSTTPRVEFNPGTYTVTVTDANACTAEETLVVAPSISALTSNLTVSDVSCFKANDGAIDPAITGGVVPVTYTWNNGASSSSLSDLGPGTYSVSAEDNVGCTIEVNNIVVWEPALLLATITKVEGVVCPNDSTGYASAVASGGVKPYTYTWKPTELVGQSVSGLPSGTYNLVVTDSNGCESYASVSILASSTTPVVDLGDDIFDPHGGIYTLDAGAHTTYAWSGGGNSRTKEVTTTGTYRVTVTNADGCEGYDEIHVEIWPTGIHQIATGQLNIYPNPASSVLNIEFGATLNNAAVSIVDVKGATVASTTLGESGTQTISVEKLPAGVYTLNVVSGEAVATHRLVIAK